MAHDCLGNPVTNAARLPARLDMLQTARLLGFSEHDIPVLIRLRLLKPLGSPPPNGHKYFATVELERLAQDAHWLDKASRAMVQHWQTKNRRPATPRARPSRGEAAPAAGEPTD
jgi:hypothetical protein